MSAAETWAVAKAGRTKYAWIVALAGYSGTPAEEMRGVQAPPVPAPPTPGPRPQPSPDFLCAEHNVEFFKRGKMKGYAHPVKDETTADGRQAWHNMPESQNDTSSPQAQMYCDQHQVGYGRLRTPDVERDGAIIVGHPILAHRIRDSKKWCYQNPADAPGALFPHADAPPPTEADVEIPAEAHEDADPPDIDLTSSPGRKKVVL